MRENKTHSSQNILSLKNSIFTFLNIEEPMGFKNKNKHKMYMRWTIIENYNLKSTERLKWSFFIVLNWINKKKMFWRRTALVLFFIIISELARKLLFNHIIRDAFLLNIATSFHYQKNVSLKIIIIEQRKQL